MPDSTRFPSSEAFQLHCREQYFRRPPRAHAGVISNGLPHTWQVIETHALRLEVVTDEITGGLVNVIP